MLQRFNIEYLDSRRDVEKCLRPKQSHIREDADFFTLFWRVSMHHGGTILLCITNPCHGCIRPNFYMLFMHHSASGQDIHVSEIFLQRPMINLRLTFTSPMSYCSSKYLLRLFESFLVPPAFSMARSLVLLLNPASLFQPSLASSAPSARRLSGQ